MESVQNEDGGWGEDLRSYRDRGWIGRGASTASQTAWALLTLLSAGERESASVERGIAWLADAQRPDGSWDEPYFTGTGFPWDFSINYHLYRQVFPLTALGRYVNGEPFPARLRAPRRGELMADARARGPGTAPLLIACALGIERLALRTGDRGGAPDAMTVLRTGMGPDNAGRAIGGALAAEALRDAAVLATGFCAGLAPGMRPGDLVVADETRDVHGTSPCTGTALLVKELGRALPGRAVHTGPLIGSDHLVRGPERGELFAAGAVAVDMESAATLRRALRARRTAARCRRPGGRGRPQHELVRIGTIRGGISAFRVLRAVLPAFFEWHRSSLLPRR
ncbi:hypothetical protein SALBM135S_04302 [Streptomyces alboniger]